MKERQGKEQREGGGRCGKDEGRGGIRKKVGNGD